MLRNEIASFNIAFSLIVLLMTIYITNPLQLSVFPGLLLVLTLFRLSLNVASALRGTCGGAAATLPYTVRYSARQ